MISIFETFCLNFQLLEPPEPSFPPPPPPSAPVSDWNTPQTEGGDWNNDAWNSHGSESWDQEPPHAPDYTNHNNAGGVNNQGFRGGGMQQQASEEGWDDDWDDENEDNSSNSTTNTSQVKSSPWLPIGHFFLWLFWMANVTYFIFFTCRCKYNKCWYTTSLKHFSFVALNILLNSVSSLPKLFWNY